MTFIGARKTFTGKQYPGDPSFVSYGIKKGQISTSLEEFKYPIMYIHNSRFHVRSCDITVTIQTTDRVVAA
jgi:hypothetical protein